MVSEQGFSPSAEGSRRSCTHPAGRKQAACSLPVTSAHAAHIADAQRTSVSQQLGCTLLAECPQKTEEGLRTKRRLWTQNQHWADRTARPLQLLRGSNFRKRAHFHPDPTADPIIIPVYILKIFPSRAMISLVQKCLSPLHNNNVILTLKNKKEKRRPLD